MYYISDDIRVYRAYRASSAVASVQLCMVDGMLWAPRDMVMFFTFTGDKTSRKGLNQRMDDFVAEHPEWQQSVREFQLKTDGGFTYKAKYYDVHILEAIMLHFGTVDEQFLSWAKVQIGEMRQEQLDDLVNSLKRKDEELAAQFEYCWIDRLWYTGERLRESGRYANSGGWYIIWWLSCLAMGVLLPLECLDFSPLRIVLYIIVAIILFIAYRKRFTPERRQAIYVHYGLPIQYFSRLKCCGIIVGILCLGYLLAFGMMFLLNRLAN